MLFCVQLAFADNFKNELLKSNDEYLRKVDKNLLTDLATNGQHPKAIIVSCSDSRVVPEYIFNAKPGDLFVVRTAGEGVDNIVLNSIEYGVEHLNIDKIIMMGHTKCGAVQATIDDKEHNTLTEEIRPSVEVAKKQCKKGNISTCSAIENIHEMYGNIAKSEVVKSKKIKVYYAMYDVETGKVTFVK